MGSAQAAHRRRTGTELSPQESEAPSLSIYIYLPQEMEDLVALLPAQYVMSTTLHDRLVHLQLLKRLRAQPELQVHQHAGSPTTHSLARSLTHSHTHSLTHSLTHTLTQPLTHTLTLPRVFMAV